MTTDSGWLGGCAGPKEETMTLADKIREFARAHVGDCNGIHCCCGADDFNEHVESVALEAERVERETIERCHRAARGVETHLAAEAICQRAKGDVSVAMRALTGAAGAATAADAVRDLLSALSPPKDPAND